MNDFLIPLNGLTAGKTRFSWTACKKFFEDFENSEILDANLSVEVVVEKSGSYIGVDCIVEGDLTLECNRCLENLIRPIELDIRLSLKYGPEEESEDVEDEERETIFLESDVTEYDMSQVIYDYVCLSLPIQCVHPEGECNPEALKYLIGVSDEDFSEETKDEQEEHNPFASLKDLFKN